MKKYLKFIILISIILSLFSTKISWAGDVTFVGSLPDECKIQGNCTLNDFVLLFAIYYKKFFGIVGSLALLMFVYGGIMFLISAGNQERITQAKKILIGSIIGLVIVFTSFAITQFIFTALKIPDTSSGEWAESGWFE